MRIGPAGHVMAESAPTRVIEVVHPADEIQVVLARLRVGEADVLVDQLAGMLVAEVPADHFPGMAIDEHHATAPAILQHGAEERRVQPVEMDLALRVHVVEQRLERGQRGLVAEAHIAGRHRLDLKLGQRAQLAPDVLPAPGREPRQILVVGAEVDRYPRQRLALQQHEAGCRAGAGESARIRVVGRAEQRRILRDVLDDQQPAFAPIRRLQPLRQGSGCHRRRQRRVFGHGGAGEARAPAQQATPAAVARQAGNTPAQRVVGRGQQVERRHEHRHALRRMTGRKAGRRVRHEGAEQAIGFELCDERHA